MTDAREALRREAAVHVAIVDALTGLKPKLPLDLLSDLRKELDRIYTTIEKRSRKE